MFNERESLKEQTQFSFKFKITRTTSNNQKMKICTVTVLIFVSVHLFLNVEGTNGSVIKNDADKEDIKSSVVLVKPASMTDAQYTKFMKQVDGKDMTDEQKLKWWEKVQNWWSKLMGIVKDVGAIAAVVSAVVKVGSIVASAFG